MNSFGNFDDSKREYVITRPDAPLPWLNYLGQDEFFGLCTNTWKDANMRRLTRYRYNNVPHDLGGRYIYVNAGGSVWNPGRKPIKAKLDSYEFRHGLGFTRIVGEKDGLEVEMLFFVPPGENLELWKVMVRNKSKVKNQPKIFSFREFCLFDAANDMNNLQRAYSIGEVEIDGSEIHHKTEYPEQRNHYTPFACTRERILDIGATQLSDGTCYRQYQPLTKQGNAEIGGDFYDDHLRPILSTCQYTKKQGSPRMCLLDCSDCLNVRNVSMDPNESIECAGDVKAEHPCTLLPSEDFSES